MLVEKFKSVNDFPSSSIDIDGFIPGFDGVKPSGFWIDENL